MSDIRERHVNGGPLESYERDVCEHCFGEWPCDAITEAHRADKAEAALELAVIRANGMEHARDAARADAKALAEALRDTMRELRHWVDEARKHNPGWIDMGYEPYLNKPSLALGTMDAETALAAHDALEAVQGPT